MNPEERAQYISSARAQVSGGAKLYTALEQKVLLLAEDRLRLALLEYEKKLGKRKAWHTPLGIAVTMGIALLTTQFQTAFGYSADFWKGAFTFALLICLVWLVWSGYLSFRAKSSINELVDSLTEGRQPLESDEGPSEEDSDSDAPITFTATTGFQGRQGRDDPTQSVR